MMMEEFEVKFLNVDATEIEKKLSSMGAQKTAAFFYKRVVFDYPDMRLDKDAAWLRLRTDGKHTTLTFKQRIGVSARDGSANDKGMEEIEVSVEDFGTMRTILLRAGLVEKYYQENKRIRWQKDAMEFDLDFWPKLEPFLEIEAPSWRQVDRAIMLLGLNPADKKIFSVNQVYRLSGIEPNDYQRMTFKKFIKKS